MKSEFVTLTAFLITIASPAHAGFGAHGGGALICKESDGTERVELLDLSEAKSRGYDIAVSDDPINQQITRAIEKLKPKHIELYREVLDAYQKLSVNLTAPPAGLKISPPDDARVAFIPENCELKGVAKYVDAAGKLYRDEGLNSRMSLTDQAALWVHEAVYKVLRQNEGVSDSIAVRSVVGLLFSSDPIPAALVSSELTRHCAGNGQKCKVAVEMAKELFASGRLLTEADLEAAQGEYIFESFLMSNGRFIRWSAAYGSISSRGPGAERVFGTCFCELYQPLSELKFKEWERLRTVCKDAFFPVGDPAKSNMRITKEGLIVLHIPFRIDGLSIESDTYLVAFRRLN